MTVTEQWPLDRTTPSTYGKPCNKYCRKNALYELPACRHIFISQDEKRVDQSPTTTYQDVGIETPVDLGDFREVSDNQGIHHMHHMHLLYIVAEIIVSSSDRQKKNARLVQFTGKWVYLLLLSFTHSPFPKFEPYVAPLLFPPPCQLLPPQGSESRGSLGAGYAGMSVPGNHIIKSIFGLYAYLQEASGLSVQVTTGGELKTDLRLPILDVHNDA